MALYSICVVVMNGSVRVERTSSIKASEHQGIQAFKVNKVIREKREENQGRKNKKYASIS